MVLQSRSRVPQKKKIAAENLELIDLAREFSGKSFEISRLVENFSSLPSFPKGEDLSETFTKLLKTVPSLLREELSLVSSLVKKVLSAANEEPLPISDVSVGVHVGRVMEMTKSMLVMALETITSSIETQREWVDKGSQKVENLMTSLPPEGEEEGYSFPREEILSKVVIVVDSLVAVVEKEKDKISNAVDSVASALESLEKTLESAKEGRVG